MRKNLYNITGNYELLLNMLYDEDADEKMILDTIESIEGEFEDKADGYAKIMTELNSLVEARERESKRLSNSAKILKNRVENLKKNLFNAMKTTGKTDFNTELFSFKISKAGGEQSLTIYGEVPEEYTKIVYESNKDKIRTELESGVELNFARLEPRKEVLKIK